MIHQGSPVRRDCGGAPHGADDLTTEPDHRYQTILPSNQGRPWRSSTSITQRSESNRVWRSM